MHVLCFQVIIGSRGRLVSPDSFIRIGANARRFPSESPHALSPRLLVFGFVLRVDTAE